jgi:hypothetical protein
MRRATFVLAALLMTAACGSMGSGGLGSIGDIILGSPSSTQSSDVKGTVSAIDTNAHRVDLDVTYVNNLRDTNNGQAGSIYYDNNTRVTYNGKDYAVTDLERGDQVEVTGVASNGRYVASQIVVVRDVS